MNSKQITAAFKLALWRAHAKGLTDPEAIVEAMWDDPAMKPVLADTVATDPILSDGLRRAIEELVAAEPPPEPEAER